MRVFIVAALVALSLVPLDAAAQTRSEEPPPSDRCVEARIYLVAFRADTGRPLTGPDSAPIWRGCYGGEVAPPPPPASRRDRHMNGR